MGVSFRLFNNGQSRCEVAAEDLEEVLEVAQHLRVVGMQLPGEEKEMQGEVKEVVQVEKEYEIKESKESEIGEKEEGEVFKAEEFREGVQG